MAISEIVGAFGAVVGVISPFFSWLWIKDERKKAERLKNNMLETDAVGKLLNLQSEGLAEEIERDKKIDELRNLRIESLMDEIRTYREEREREKEEHEKEKVARAKEREETEKFRLKMSEDMDFLIRCYKSVLKSTCSVANCPLRKPSCELDNMSDNDKKRLKEIL